MPLLQQQPVSAVERCSTAAACARWKTCRACQWVRSLSGGACALLIESRRDAIAAARADRRIMASIAHFPVEKQVDFSEDPVYNQLWKIRKEPSPPSAPCARPAPR